MKPLRWLLAGCLPACLAMCAAVAAQAQALQDPMRPPAQLLATTRVAVAAPAATARAPQPQLQSVLIARQQGGRHVAVIDGETVRLGASFRGARVVRMTQTEVELVRGRERQVLKLFPTEVRSAAND